MTVRLNLGAGDDRMPPEDGWVNVDLRDDVADVVGPADALPWDDGTVSEIRAMDLLEHFWRDDVVAVLAEWRRVLEPGGVITLRVPNLLELSRQLARAGERQERHAASAGHLVDETIRNIYGGHRWGPEGSWDTHHWGYTPISLERLLEQSGFVVLGNDRRANMTLTCRKEGK